VTSAADSATRPLSFPSVVNSSPTTLKAVGEDLGAGAIQRLVKKGNKFQFPRNLWED
jgi:hypothetical protein